MQSSVRLSEKALSGEGSQKLVVPQTQLNGRGYTVAGRMQESSYRAFIRGYWFDLFRLSQSDQIQVGNQPGIGELVVEAYPAEWALPGHGGQVGLA